MAILEDESHNVQIFTDSAGLKPLTSTTDGAKERLDVNASSDPTAYQLDTDYDATGVSVTTSGDTELFSFTGAGIIDYISITNPTSSNYEIVINIDASESLRITMADLGSSFNLTSGDSPIWASTANKVFHFRPDQGSGFTTSFSVEGKATTGTQTLRHIVLFRDQT